MAKTKLSQAAYVKRGYGQVEINLLDASNPGGQILAQLPAAADIDVLENGQFAKYNYKDGVVDFNGEGDWMLVFNEIKLYEDRQTEEDWAMIKDNYEARVYDALGNLMPANTTMVPRLLGTRVGDIYTTNMVNETTLNVGDKLKVGAKGMLSKSGNSTMTWQVVKVYTMPDGQPGVKLIRIV